MHRTMLKSKLDRAAVTLSARFENYCPRVADVGANNEIVSVDHEVATLPGAPTEPVAVA